MTGAAAKFNIKFNSRSTEGATWLSPSHSWEALGIPRNPFASSTHGDDTPHVGRLLLLPVSINEIKLFSGDQKSANQTQLVIPLLPDLKRSVNSRP